MTFSKCPTNSVLKNVKKLYQRWQYSQDVNKYVKNTWNWNQHLQEYFNKRSLWMMECFHGFLWPKGVSANFLIVFRCCKDANNINNIVDHFWCQNYQFWHFLINFDLTFLAKHCFFFIPKMVKILHSPEDVLAFPWRKHSALFWHKGMQKFKIIGKPLLGET